MVINERRAELIAHEAQIALDRALATFEAGGERARVREAPGAYLLVNLFEPRQRACMDVGCYRGSIG